MAHVTVPSEVRELCKDWKADHQKRGRPIGKCFVLNDARATLQDFIARKQRGTDVSGIIATVPMADLLESLDIIERTLGGGA